MLISSYTSLAENSIIKCIRAFFSSVYYPAFIALITACANLFSLELPVYYLYMMTVILTVLVAEDTSPFIPMIACGYMTVSPPNNPAAYPGTLFTSQACIVQIAIIAGIIAVLAVARLFHDLFILKDRSGRGVGVPKLTYGFIALGAAFILGGLFSTRISLTGGAAEGSAYSFKTALFGVVQILCLSFFYFYLYFTVNKKNLSKSYYEVLFTSIGWLMVAEVIRMYFNSGVFTTEGIIRGKLLQGWGVYNNVGCIMAMMIPAPFSLALNARRKVPHLITGALFYASVLLTLSRGAMIFGTVVFAACLTLYFIKSPRKTRKIGYIVLCVAAVATGVLAIIFKDIISYLYSSVISAGLESNGRIAIYLDGLKQFCLNPFFGNGFYECPTTAFGKMPPFIPPRYHNTAMQIMASCGLAGVAAYTVHRTQTVMLLLKKPVGAKPFIATSISALLLTSLVDCNIFNLGPGLIYSVLLVLAEILYDEPKQKGEVVIGKNNV